MEKNFFYIPLFHLHNNAPCLSTKILHNRCFQFFLGITMVPREIKDNAYAKFRGGGVNKVHYDWRENIEFEKTSLL